MIPGKGIVNEGKELNLGDLLSDTLSKVGNPNEQHYTAGQLLCLNYFDQGMDLCF